MFFLFLLQLLRFLPEFVFERLRVHLFVQRFELALQQLVQLLADAFLIQRRSMIYILIYGLFVRHSLPSYSVSRRILSL